MPIVVILTIIETLENVAIEGPHSEGNLIATL